MQSNLFGTLTDSHHIDTGHYAYFNGPYVQSENKLHTFDATAGTKLTTTSNAQANPYVGIIERQTNASYMSGLDIKHTSAIQRWSQNDFTVWVSCVHHATPQPHANCSPMIQFKDIEGLAKAIMLCGGLVGQHNGRRCSQDSCSFIWCATSL